jgi:hypothetical protein
VRASVRTNCVLCKSFTYESIAGNKGGEGMGSKGTSMIRCLSDQTAVPCNTLLQKQY